jgi:hypothetical protein
MKDERWKMKDERWKMKDERWKIKIYCWWMIYDEDLLYVDDKIYDQNLLCDEWMKDEWFIVRLMI